MSMADAIEIAELRSRIDRLEKWVSSIDAHLNSTDSEDADLDLEPRDE